MGNALKAEDLLPLAARLSARERRRLATRLLALPTPATPNSDAERYRDHPPTSDESMATDAGVAFDPLGWDEFYATR